MSVYARAYSERDGSVFAEYPKLTIEYRDASHRYWIHTEGQRFAAASVTSILKVLDKPSLLSWAERCGAAGAAQLADLGELQGVPYDEAVHVVRLHKLGMDAKRDAGADRGTAVHRVLELYASEGIVPKLADFEPEVRGYVQGLSAFLVSAQPQAEAIEVLVGSAEHEYAGRLDMIATLNGKRTLIDLKTNPAARVYPEAHIQTQGYVLALPECGIEPPQECVVVAVGADGSFSTSQACADPDDFLAVLRCYRSMGRIKAAVTAQEKLVKEALEAA